MEQITYNTGNSYFTTQLKLAEMNLEKESVLRFLNNDIARHIYSC